MTTTKQTAEAPGVVEGLSYSEASAELDAISRSSRPG
jgi:hypothetical protein